VSAAAAAAIETLLAQRGAGQTICPSEAARLLAGANSDWRGAMPQVHQAARILAANGEVRLTWRGEPIGEAGGPYRIVRG